MKLLYDCTVLTKWEGHHTGIQRTVAQLGEAISKIAPYAQICVFNEEGICFQHSLQTGKRGSELRIERGDIIFSANHDWDYPEHTKVLHRHVASGALLSVLFHDIIPLKLPFSYSPEFVRRFDEWLDQTLRKVGPAFAVSARTRDDLIACTSERQIRAPEIHVVRLGADLPTLHTHSEEITHKAKEKFALSIGTIEYRKNHQILLNSYRYLINDLNFIPPKLYIAGKQGYLDGGISLQADLDPRLAGMVEVFTGLSDADIQQLYRAAQFTMYPSLYEGWGLPVAESLHFWKPCITSKGTSMVEIAPGLVRLAHPLMVEEWAHHIRELSDPETSDRESARIRDNYQAPTWRQTATAIIDRLHLRFPGLRLR